MRARCIERVRLAADRCRCDFLCRKRAAQAAWAIFAPFNVVNFLFIPVRFQPLAHASVSFVYNTAVSAIANAEAVRDRRASARKRRVD